MRCLLLATRDVIRANLGYTASQCEVMPPPGEPPAGAGEVYAAVWDGGWNNKERNFLRGEYRVTVTVSLRAPRVPADRRGVKLLHLAALGLSDRVADIAGVIGRDTWDFPVSRQANLYLGDPLDSTEPTGFRQALVFQTASRPRKVGPEWFSAARAKGGDDTAGWVVDVEFGGAIRPQAWANQVGGGGGGPSPPLPPPLAGGVINETPGGVLDGSNRTFTLAFAPHPSSSLMLFLNGLLLRAGAGNDFTLSGATITLATAPGATDHLLAAYLTG